MKIDCIYFDLDSVLYLPDDFLTATLKLSVREMILFGLKAGFDEALAYLDSIRKEDANAGDHFDRLCAHCNGEVDPIIVAAGVEKYRDSKHSNMMAAPHAQVVLSRLAARYPLAVISNGIPVKQAAKLVRLGLSHYFTRFDSSGNILARHFFATYEARRMKPAPYLWEEARKIMGFEFANSVMIGDRFWADILGAKRLGMRTVKVDQGGHCQETWEEAYRNNAATIPELFPEAISIQEAGRLMTPDATVKGLIELETVLAAFAQE